MGYTRGTRGRTARGVRGDMRAGHTKTNTQDRSSGLSDRPGVYRPTAYHDKPPITPTAVGIRMATPTAVGIDGYGLQYLRPTPVSDGLVGQVQP